MASAGYLLCTILSPKHVVRILNEHTHGQEMVFILQDSGNADITDTTDKLTFCHNRKLTVTKLLYCMLHIKCNKQLFTSGSLTAGNFPDSVWLTQSRVTHPQSPILCGPAVASLVREDGGGGGG